MSIIHNLRHFQIVMETSLSGLTGEVVPRRVEEERGLVQEHAAIQQNRATVMTVQD